LQFLELKDLTIHSIMQTSRRTTRRPQTQAQTALASGSQLGQNPAQYPAPYYPYHYPGPGYPPYPPFPPNAASGQADAEIKEGSDAWKAAHNILTAINLGGLPGREDRKAGGPGGTQSDPSASATGANTADHPVLGPADARHFRPATSAGTTLPGTIEGRAELQVHLALLAAQLMDIAQTGEVSVAPDQRPVAVNSQAGRQDEDEESDEDMAEVPVVNTAAT
jgi:hypothetical protein